VILNHPSLVIEKATEESNCLKYLDLYRFIIKSICDILMNKFVCFFVPMFTSLCCLGDLESPPITSAGCAVINHPENFKFPDLSIHSGTVTVSVTYHWIPVRYSDFRAFFFHTVGAGRLQWAVGSGQWAVGTHISKASTNGYKNEKDQSIL
jgi:hypothetical protein